MGSDRWPPASGTAARRLGESTRALRLPPPVPSQHPLGTPVYRTAAFAFDSPAQYAAVLAGTAPGCTYSQIDNPTVDAFGAAVAGLDTPHGGREAGMAFAGRLRIAQVATSLGGTHTKVSHAASSTHRQLDSAALTAAGTAQADRQQAGGRRKQPRTEEA